MATKKKTKPVDGDVYKTFATEVMKGAKSKARSIVGKSPTLATGYKGAVKKRAWQPTIGAKLGPQEQKLRDLLTGRDAKPASMLFLKIVNPTLINGTTRRQMQQRIGAIAARHNRKVKSPHIVRGDKPGTYRLKRVR